MGEESCEHAEGFVAHDLVLALDEAKHYVEGSLLQRLEFGVGVQSSGFRV